MCHYNLACTKAVFELSFANTTIYIESSQSLTLKSLAKKTSRYINIIAQLVNLARHDVDDVVF